MSSTTNPKDVDSDPCSMSASGEPSQDDEDKLCINVNNPIISTIDIELDKSLINPTMMNKYKVGDKISFKLIVTNK